MKKLLVISLLAALCTSAAAQKEILCSPWDMGGVHAISYNYATHTPQNMSHHGLGLDLCLFQVEYKLNHNTSFTLGVLDLLLDFRYLEKGYVFETKETGFGSSGSVITIERAPQDARAKANMTDFCFSFPLGITQRLAPRWQVSAYVAPGVGLISYHNNHILGDIHHRDRFYPTQGRVGFRLDLKAALWFEDVALYFRYRPVSYTFADSGQKTNTFSVGLAFRY